MGSISKDILNVFKLNQHGTLAVVIPAKIAKETGIVDGSTVTVTKQGKSIHYNVIKID